MPNVDFKDKSILVTGGAGSIGKELVKQLLKHDPKVIRVLDNNETGLFDVEQELAQNKQKLRFFVGDIRDKGRLVRATEGVDFVFHAAALKHVYLCEYNPTEAVKTNVVGTQNVIDACLENNVERMVFISTDKAVDPTSVMGTTKLLGEKLVTAANVQKGNKRTIFCSVRFGNVLASRGSVVPIFMRQIREGGPVTITDERMTRFIMKPSNAVQLVLQAAMLAKGGELFILKMPSVKISDLAEVMIEKFASRYGKKPDQIKTKVIGSRPGEKIHEDLITESEMVEAEEIGDLILIKPVIGSFNQTQKKKSAGIKYGNSEKSIKKEEIGQILDSMDLW